jgi:hypothetical protein
MFNKKKGYDLKRTRYLDDKKDDLLGGGKGFANE